MRIARALSLAALAGAPADNPLLPAVRDGWRGERLELPLSFAPDIDLRGHEQLAFAPGMSDPDSDSYFSYAFALHLEQPPTTDAAFLQSFLDRYYRGLCGAVAGSRQLELEPGRLEAIRSRVAPGAHGFVAQIDLFDPFTTGGALLREPRCPGTARGRPAQP